MTPSPPITRIMRASDAFWGTHGRAPVWSDKRDVGRIMSDAQAPAELVRHILRFGWSTPRHAA